MERKDFVAEEGEGSVPAGVTAGRAAKLLGLGHPDSVRRVWREGKIERNDDGLYTLASVLAEKAKRDAATVTP